ncbi:MAG: acetylornithine transaminase [Chloroflexota bacterium]|nr:acetylornithine transaminase [Chloroflexota bacterium]
MSTSDWIERESKYLFQNYGRQPVVIERGEGSRVWDSEGNQYLDFVGGLAVTSLGHAHPAVVAAASMQAERLVHVSNLYYTTPMIELAELLVENSPLDRVFFCNSGTEAIEAAIKLARRYGHDERSRAHGIIAMDDGFHGRSLGALAAAGTARYREPFEPMPGGFTHVPWNDLEALHEATDDNTVAVLVEPIQGEGGVNVPSPTYLKGVRDWCDENGLLLILDEIQSGVGRTGTLWAHEQEGIEPDVMCVAKGLAGGLPIGAVLAREELAGYLTPGDHASTFGANPVAAAAGVAVLRHIFENDLLAAARRASGRLVDRLLHLQDTLPAVTEVRGRGLLLAVSFSTEAAARVVALCRERGLLVNNVRPDRIRLMPALIVEDDEIDRACDLLEEAIRAGTS